MCQLLDVMKFHLEAFGVQIYPFLSTDKLPQLSYFFYNALEWGLAALGVFKGSKLLLVPVLICKIRLAYATILVAAMNWENNFKNQDVVLAAIKSYVPVFILLVVLVMACSSHRTLCSYYFGTGAQQREVKINIARVEEGEVDIVMAPKTVEAEEMKRKLETLLWKKEEELVAAEDEVAEGIATAPTETDGIYPVLGSPTSPV